MTKTEYEIMKILWRANKPLLISEILEESKNAKVAKNSLHPLLKKLINEGFVQITGHIKVAKTKSRFYAPAVTIDEYAAHEIRDLFKTSNKQFSLNKFLSYFVQDKESNTEEIVKELEAFIEDYKNN